MTHLLILISYCECWYFFYKVGQTLRGLTLDKSYMQTKKIQREYNILNNNQIYSFIDLLLKLVFVIPWFLALSFSFWFIWFLPWFPFWSGFVDLKPRRSSSFLLPSGSSFSKLSQDHVISILANLKTLFLRNILFSIKGITLFVLGCEATYISVSPKIPK
jgi:hypothetical protein